jgi:hypothetical protein
MRRALLLTAAVLAAVIFFVLATLPPNPVDVGTAGAHPDLLRRTVAGAYHIHTTRSDGARDKASVAAAAARANLEFAIFTDHGDGTRAPDPPAYISGVLCIDGVEISTNGGHYVALDMPASPYPLGGEAAAVVEDVARLGGFGIAAHPDSPKRELAWTDWRAPVDGIEWLNIDSEWRDESRSTLARAFLQLPVRPAPAIASLFDRPDTTIARWSRALEERPVVALAAVDAHGGMRRRLEGGMPAGIGPSYESSFRTLSNRVLLERPFSGDAVSDGRLLLDAIRKGRVYTVVDALASPVLFDFNTSAPSWKIPAGARVEQVGDDPANAWYQVHLESAPGTPPVPWVLTNPVSFRPRSVGTVAVADLSGDPVAGEWRVESDPSSAGTVTSTTDGAIVLDYRLGTPQASQFVAIAVDVGRVVPARHVLFDAHSSAPMRVSVQLRVPALNERWTKSVYVDGTRREAIVPVADLVAAEDRSSRMPATDSPGSLLFVVDLTNTPPGASGKLTLRNVRIAR